MANILRDKIYFLVLASVCYSNYTLAGDNKVPTVMKIKFYYTEAALVNANPSAIIPVPITSATTFYDLQNSLRQAMIYKTVFVKD